MGEIPIMAPLPPASCSPGANPRLNELRKLRANVQTLIGKVDSDISLTNTRVANTVNENSFSSFTLQNFDNIGGIPNAEKIFLFGQNGKPIVPDNVTYEVDPNSLYGILWGNTRPPGMHPNGRYASKKGENLRMLEAILPDIIAPLADKDKQAFTSFVTYIQKHESGNRLGQPIAINGGFDARPREGRTYNSDDLVNADAGPFPRKNPIKKEDISSPYRQGDGYRADYGCWQYVPKTWLGLMKKYKMPLLREHPEYRFCWLAPPELEVELQLRSMYDAWLAIPLNTPYIIKATMLYMYNFLPVTYNSLNNKIQALGDASNAWTAYLREYEALVVSGNETSVSLDPLNNLAYLKSIASSYKKMKANPAISQLESYSVPEDPIPLFNKYNKGK